MTVLVSVALVLCIAVWFRTRSGTEAMPEQSNPAELRSALVFGALYAIILFVIAATKIHFERKGLFVVAVLSGLTDMDAITLSTSRMVAAGRLTSETGWKLIGSAAMANLIFKTGLIATLGHRKVLWQIAILFGNMFFVGAVLNALLP